MHHLPKSLWRFLISGLILWPLACSEPEVAESVPNPKPLFKLVSPSQSGIDFQNSLQEGLNTNILMYEYFYNGGGVAIGDVNGDQLPDIYFTANMGANKLYLNQGDLKFKEVGGLSGASGRPGPWKTGVTMVDINGDDKLDLYVSYSGSLPEAKRSNQLFINQGNNADQIPMFKESADEYGLSSPGFTNQAYFFDCDLDGDLDVLLLNHNPKSLPVLNESNTKSFLAQDDPMRGLRLLKQDQGYFEDKTQESGIVGSGLSYGLGVGITDINQDGWADFYVSNDYTVPDYLYINQQDGNFKNELNERLSHNSHFSMGNDIADLNNDGRTDIITLDMLPEDNHRQKLLLAPDNYEKFDLNLRSGFHYQYMRNMLQINNGDGTFSEIGQMAGISNTDWSWAALAGDYDNDGWKDLFITNGYYRDYTNLDFISYMNNYVRTKGRLVREDVLDIISHMPSSNVVNYIFSNQQGEAFQNENHNWGFTQASNSNGASFADLDLDGDLDLVINNINEPAFLYENQLRQQTDLHYLQFQLKGASLNRRGIGARVILHQNGMQQVQEQMPTRGYLSSISPLLHFGLGKDTLIDSVQIIWPGGQTEVKRQVSSNQIVVFDQNKAQPKNPQSPVQKSLFEEVPSLVDFSHSPTPINDFKRQSLLIQQYSQEGSAMLKGDVNQDGLEDIWIGGKFDQPAALFLQQKDQSFEQKENPDFEKDRIFVDIDAVWIDANGDGFQDLFVASGGYHFFQPNDPLLQDRLYLNDGNGAFSYAADRLPKMYSSVGAVSVIDINSDGHSDLFIGGGLVPGRYPETPRSFILINDGKGNFSDQTESIAPTIQQIGMVRDAASRDLNGDDQTELILVGEWMPITVFEKMGNEWINNSEKYFEKERVGWWNCIEIEDLNGDQKPDLIVGNTGLNTQFQASDENPAEMYFDDFDQNGSVDPFFCYYIRGTSYPDVSRDEFLRQLVSYKSKYPSYELFADVRMEDLFSQQQLNKAQHLKANHMATSLFLQNENQRFDYQALPKAAQYAPVYAIAILDFNEDDNMDLLLCGNNSHTKLRLGRLSANYGMLFSGDGKGNFEYISQMESGFQVKGDVRKLTQINGNLYILRTTGPILSYQAVK